MRQCWCVAAGLFLGAFLSMASGVGPSPASLAWAAPAGEVSHTGKPGEEYDGFFACTFDVTNRSHEMSGTEAAFTQQAFRATGRFDYFGKDNKSALGSIPGIEGVVSLGWAGGASYSGGTAGGGPRRWRTAEGSCSTSL